MLKTVLKALAAALALVVVVFVVIFGAESISVPVPKADYQACLNAAKAEKNRYPNCKAEETVWDRGLSDPIAYYTLWLTFFTLALATVGIAQSILTAQQIRLARDEFLATHRPHINILSLRITSDEEDVTEGVDPRVEVLLRFVNSGDSDATILNIGSAIVQSVGDHIDFTDPENWKPTKLVSGEEGTFFITSGKIRASEAYEDALFCVGYVLYADDLGHRRKTGFCRMYDSTDSTWSIKYTDFEYAY